MIDKERVQWLTRELLIAIGEDPERSGLRDTPNRVAKWWQEFVDYQPGTMDTVFGIENVDEMVVVSGMRVWSLCEHHLLPFSANITIGYIPTKSVLGLSKFGRIAQAHAHKLQIQEKLVQDIADDVESFANTPHVAVLADGEHLCMTMRGVKTPASMRSSVLRGEFKNPEVRAEFLALANTKNL